MAIFNHKCTCWKHFSIFNSNSWMWQIPLLIQGNGVFTKAQLRCLVVIHLLLSGERKRIQKAAELAWACVRFSHTWFSCFNLELGKLWSWKWLRECNGYIYYYAHFVHKMLFLFEYNLKYKERDSKMFEEYEGIILKRWDVIKGARVKIQFAITNFT